MSDGPLPESTCGVDSSPESIAAMQRRLAAVRPMIGAMCSQGRPPAMSVPADRERDEDLLISDTADAAAALLAQVARERDEADRIKEAFREKYNACKIREMAAERQLAETRAALAQLIESIQSHLPKLALYERVHGELDDGKAWTDIDPGFRHGDGTSYDGWLAYMQQSLINGLRDIVLTYQHRYVKTQGSRAALRRDDKRRG